MSIQLISILAVVVFFALYYANYYRKVRKAGGMAKLGEAYAREMYGLWPNERVTAQWSGLSYMGPLVPGTLQSTGGKVGDFLTGTVRRGAKVHFAFTDHQRLALAIEAGATNRQGCEHQAAKGATGLAHGLGPYAIFDPQARPRVLTAPQAFGALNPNLPAPADRPVMGNLEGSRVPFDLVQIIGPDGSSNTLWVEAHMIGALQNWAAGGAAMVDPRYA